MHRSSTGNLVHLDLEIEATLRRNRAERKRKLLQDRTIVSILEEETHFFNSSSSDSPSSRESATYLPEAVSMADEHQQRVTLEDYSRTLERFRGLLRKTPTHGFSEPIQLNMFINGLRPQTKQLLDALVGGKIKLKTPKEAIELIENMSASYHAILRDRVHQPTKKSLLELSSHDALLAQNKLLSKKLEILTETLCKLPTKLSIGQPTHSSVLQANVFPLKKTLKKFTIWEINRDNDILKENFQASSRVLITNKDSGDRTLAINSTKTKVTMSNHKSTESALKDLEVKVRQLAMQIADKSSNSFVANTEKNPKEECKAVMTRNKRFVEKENENSVVSKKKAAEKKGIDDMKDDVRGERNQEKEKQIMKKKKKMKKMKKMKKNLNEERSRSEQAREREREKVVNEGAEVPYPMVPSKKEKDRHLARFLDIFRKLEITMPFREALQQMPLYSKFLKDMLIRKHKYIHQENIVVEGNCSVVIQKILSPKHKDPGSVTIPCSIGEVTVGKALIDLGANINLMPLSMCRRLEELEIMPTRMTLQLVDCSITRPYGVIEEVLVRVTHFIFPADFVVMDICEDNDIPVILGRPFMLTASCIVDIGRKKLDLGFEDQKIDFDLFVEDKRATEQNLCLQVMEVGKEVLEVRTKT
ncbi:hypothetical protein GmHk_01G000997 [Glycine max]|nr:hypothetical protein GmHk_01G000997 [Glycine max]